MSSPQEQSAHLTRRKFLKNFGAGAAALMAIQLVGPQPAAASSGAPNPEAWGMLIDLTRCTGCNSCALACKESNNLPGAGIEPSGLSADTYTFIDTRLVTTADGASEERHVKRQCMHCIDAACVSACPAAAMYKSEEGPVVYRAERCLGCRYCQIACPFGVPQFEWENGITPTINKCWMCLDRLQEGEQPACAGACPTGAIRFGKREELLAQARAQIKSAPDRYIDHIFGEHEVGGTSVLYLSDVPFDELGFPVDLPETAPPQETQKIMNTLPTVIGGMATLMAGTAFITHRKGHKTEEKSTLPVTQGED